MPEKAVFILKRGQGLWTQERCPYFPRSPKVNEASIVKCYQIKYPWLYNITIELSISVNYQCIYGTSKHVNNVVQVIVWLHYLISDQSHIKWYLQMEMETNPCFDSHAIDSLLFYLLFYHKILVGLHLIGSRFMNTIWPGANLESKSLLNVDKDPRILTKLCFPDNRFLTTIKSQKPSNAYMRE